MAPIASSCSLFLALSSPSTWKCPASWTLGLESPSKRCGKRYSAIFVHIKERRSALSFTLENENKDCDPPSGSPLRTKKRKKGEKKGSSPTNDDDSNQLSLVGIVSLDEKMKRDSISTDDELNFDLDFLFCLFSLRQVRNEPGTRMPSMRNADETRRRFHPKRFIRFRLVFATSLPSFT